MMNQETHVTFEFDEHAGLYWPGETISGQYFVESSLPREVKALELSVLWYTQGKGDEDLSVHYFQRETVDDQGMMDLVRPRRFSTELPNSPLSYDGMIIKICWCVRVRVFLWKGRDIVAEQHFQFGFLPRPQELSKSSSASSESGADTAADQPAANERQGGK